MQSKEQLIKKFNEGTLSSDESDLLEKMFINDSLSINEFQVYNNYEEFVDQRNLSHSLDNKFRNMLSSEIENERPKSNNGHWFSLLPFPIKLAFPALLLLCGFLIGKTWQVPSSNEYAENNMLIQKNTQMVNDLLYHPSSSKRIRLVNNANNSNQNKSQTIQILFMSLNFDQSSSVRMAAVDALMNHADEAIVREGLIKSLGKQKSLFMVQYINEALRIIGENISKERLQNLVQGNIPNDEIIKLEQNIY